MNTSYNYLLPLMKKTISHRKQMGLVWSKSNEEFSSFNQSLVGLKFP